MVRVGVPNSEAGADVMISVDLVPAYVRLLEGLLRARFWQGGGRRDPWEGAAIS